MSEAGKPRKPVGADLILPVCAAAYAMYYVWSVSDFPAEAQLSGMVLAGMLLLLVAIYGVRVAAGVMAGRNSLGFGAFFGPPETRHARGIFFLLMLAALLAMPWGGFTLTTFVFLALSFVALGVRPVGRAVLVAALGALFGWLFFLVLLGTHFPAGPFERAMQAVIG